MVKAPALKAGGLRPRRSRVSSNLTGVVQREFLLSRHKETKYSVVTSWRNWIARWTSNPTVAGSNPVEVGGDKKKYFFFLLLPPAV